MVTIRADQLDRKLSVLCDPLVATCDMREKMVHLRISNGQDLKAQ